MVHPGDAGAQTEHVLETIKSVIEAAGGTMADVTFNHIFLTDWAELRRRQRGLCRVSSRATSRRATASSAGW